MLWTLHSRASGALRADGVIRDPMAVEIHRAMNYDFTRNFGRADPILAMRAALFDALLRAFLERHPRAVIVNLGEGLETQRYRIEAPEALWYSVDLPEAIAIRERFITPDERHRHLAGSALARDWMQAIPRGRPIYISAQGLFMYFSAPAVRTLLRTIRDELAPHTVVFDVIPGWLSSLSRAAGGLRRTPRYRTPRMPWGFSPRDPAAGRPRARSTAGPEQLGADHRRGRWLER